MGTSDNDKASAAASDKGSEEKGVATETDVTMKEADASAETVAAITDASTSSTAKESAKAPTATGASSNPPKNNKNKNNTDVDPEGGVGALSEEQTNAALAALQEASTIVIEAKEKEDAKNSEKKRKAVDSISMPSNKLPKKRSAPVRVAWEDRMEMLRKFKQEHGSLLIPIRYKLNPSLGKFVHNTREQYKLFHKKTPPGYKKKCSLTAERIQQLEELGFVWSTERTKRQNEDWETRLVQLKEYKEKHGDCLVPHGYDSDPSFAEWIHRQRTAYATMHKETKPNPLITERMQKLEEVGFNFTVHTDKWKDHWNMLKTYKDKHGHVQVPTHFADNPKLGRWVHTQRHQRRLQLKGKKSCMTQDRVQLLDKLEFSWEVRPSLERPRATWQQRMDELKDFHEIQSHFRVPPGTHPQLHSWCQEQKHRLKNLQKNKGKDASKRMGPERVKQLTEIGFTMESEVADPEDNVEGGEKAKEEEKQGEAVGEQEAAAAATDSKDEAAEAPTDAEVALAVVEAAETMEV